MTTKQFALFRCTNCEKYFVCISPRLKKTCPACKKQRKQTFLGYCVLNDKGDAIFEGKTYIIEYMSRKEKRKIWAINPRTRVVPNTKKKKLRGRP